VLDKTKARAIAVDYSNEVKKLLNPDKVILFGSYVNGTPHDESDIDVGVFIHGRSDEAWYKTRIQLQKLRRNKLFIDIEPHLFDEIEDASGFARHVIATGEMI
jgi:predicted nucleotidyltransferase